MNNSNSSNSGSIPPNQNLPYSPNMGHTNVPSHTFPSPEQQGIPKHPPFSQPNDPVQVPGVVPNSPDQEMNTQTAFTPPVPPEITPGIPTNPPSYNNKSTFNKRSFFIFGAIVLVSLLGATIAYVVTRNSEEGENAQNENVQTGENTQQTSDESGPGDVVDFSNSDLVRASTVLLSSTNYELKDTSFVNATPGCGLERTYSGTKSSSSYRADSTEEFTGTNSLESCGFNANPYSEVIFVDGIYYSKNALEAQYVSGSVAPTNATVSPQMYLNEVLPYPTLLTVTSANTTSRGETVVNATITNPALEGTYIFTLDLTGKITSISYDFTFADSTHIGEMDILYTIDPIIAPTTGS